MQFGENVAGKGYVVVDERIMRASSGVILLVSVIASINGFVLKNYSVLPFVIGAVALNFAIGLFVNLNWAPSVLIARLATVGQAPQYIGAVQKRFAWSLGFGLTTTIFILSLFLQANVKFFAPTCMLCLICILFLYLETAFGICVGCKLYFAAMKAKFIAKPVQVPNCMGDACDLPKRD